jgi:hypothetical protein
METKLITMAGIVIIAHTTLCIIPLHHAVFDILNRMMCDLENPQSCAVPGGAELFQLYTSLITTLHPHLSSPIYSIRWPERTIPLRRLSEIHSVFRSCVPLRNDVLLLNSGGRVEAA